SSTSVIFRLPFMTALNMRAGVPMATPCRLKVNRDENILARLLEPNEEGRHSEKLLHVTNRLYKEGIFVQIRWTRCNKTYNIQCCQYPTLVRILPEELIYFLLILFLPLVCRTPPLVRPFASLFSPSSAHSWPHPPGARHSPFRD